MTGGEGRKTPKSQSNIRIQASSATPTARERYSAFVDDQDTVSYFFEDQVMRLLPRKTRKPVVERRSTGLPAQSESVKAVRAMGQGWNNTP